DIDMVYHCHPLGMGFGVFTELSLTHLIPKERLETAYLNRLWRGVLVSNWILAKLWDRPVDLTPPQRTVDKLRHIWHFAKRPRGRHLSDVAYREAIEEFKKLRPKLEKPNHTEG
ncbi:MAG: hypothetical protein ACOCVG_00780, partial [Verrucomicrobiota bacterium]